MPVALSKELGRLRDGDGAGGNGGGALSLCQMLLGMVLPRECIFMSPSPLQLEAGL